MSNLVRLKARLSMKKVEFQAQSKKTRRSELTEVLQHVKTFSTGGKNLRNTLGSAVSTKVITTGGEQTLERCLLLSFLLSVQTWGGRGFCRAGHWTVRWSYWDPDASSRKPWWTPRRECKFRGQRPGKQEHQGWSVEEQALPNLDHSPPVASGLVVTSLENQDWSSRWSCTVAHYWSVGTHHTKRRNIGSQNHSDPKPLVLLSDPHIT